MTQPYPTPEIVDIDRAEIALETWSWPFATDRSADIDRYFTELQSQRPGVWNGRVLLLNRFAIAERTLGGACFETDYSSFITWRDREFPDPSVYNFFAAAVLRAVDGGFLLGEMASYTAGAGRTYFPCGTPEPGDVGADGMIDLGDNLRRELLEETGIAIAELDAEPGWTVVRDRCFLGLMKRLNGAAERRRGSRPDHAPHRRGQAPRTRRYPHRARAGRHRFKHAALGGCLSATGMDAVIWPNSTTRRP